MKKCAVVKIDHIKIVEIICDKCGKKITPEDTLEWQEVVSWQTVGGYGSVWGDGETVGFDLCQNCAYETFKKSIRILGRQKMDFICENLDSEHYICLCDGEKCRGSSCPIAEIIEEE